MYPKFALGSMGLSIALAVSMLASPAAPPPLEASIARPAGDLNVRMAEFTLEPGAGGSALDAQAGHRHPGHVFVYVLGGEVRSSLDDEEPVDYRRGEAWSERPGQLHRIRNLSESEPAKLLVLFVDPADPEDGSNE